MYQVCLFTLWTVLFFCIGAEIINMKIVEEPSNYGFNNFNLGNTYQDDRLKMRVKPSNFSGPVHLKRLYNKCFSKVINSYKYEFCPFYNVTQHEQSYRWNPYHGVLGVWQEWEISNNTFVAMLFREGDKCGDLFRSVRVVFECGRENKILNVTEYKTCQYKMIFSTPHCCPPHAMLVYPTLNPQLREAWDMLEGQYQNQEITLKGYNKRIRTIFEDAGYCISPSHQADIAKKAIETETQGEKEGRGEFETLLQCTEEYKKLKKEIEGLRALLALKDDSVDVLHQPDTEKNVVHTTHDTHKNLKRIMDMKRNHSSTNEEMHV